MATTMELVERARTLVMGSRRDLTGQMSAANMSDSATTLTLAAAIVGLAVGNVVEVDLELMYVTALPTSTTPTVIRGYAGSQPSDHLASAIVRVNPVAPAHMILANINATLRSLSSPASGLARVGTVDIDTNQGNDGYNLNVDDGYISVRGVRWRTNNNGLWEKVPFQKWAVLPGADTDDFPSGVAIVFNDPPSAYTCRVYVDYAFGELSDAAEDPVSATGLPSTALDLLELGAAIRSVEGREIARTDLSAQGDSRRPEEVPAGSARLSTSLLDRRFQARLAEEAARFARTWTFV